MSLENFLRKKRKAIFFKKPWLVHTNNSSTSLQSPAFKSLERNWNWRKSKWPSINLHISGFFSQKKTKWPPMSTKQVFGQRLPLMKMDYKEWRRWVKGFRESALKREEGSSTFFRCFMENILSYKVATPPPSNILLV